MWSPGAQLFLPPLLPSGQLLLFHNKKDASALTTASKKFWHKNGGLKDGDNPVCRNKGSAKEIQLE